MESLKSLKFARSKFERVGCKLGLESEVEFFNNVSEEQRTFFFRVTPSFKHP